MLNKQSRAQSPINMQMPKLHFVLGFISMERCISQWEVPRTRISAIMQFGWQLNITWVDTATFSWSLSSGEKWIFFENALHPFARLFFWINALPSNLDKFGISLWEGLCKVTFECIRRVFQGQTEEVCSQNNLWLVSKCRYVHVQSNKLGLDFAADFRKHQTECFSSILKHPKPKTQTTTEPTPTPNCNLS